MRPKTSAFIAASLDGFIARENGDIDWLEQAVLPPGTDLGFRQFMGTVDCLVMGRRTFEKVLTFESWPYQGTPVVVLSSEVLEVPANLREQVSIGSGALDKLLSELGQKGAKSIYVDGGATIQGFIEEGLLDEITITRVPVLLGAGISLFGASGKAAKLQHVSTVSFPGGYFQSKYVFA